MHIHPGSPHSLQTKVLYSPWPAPCATQPIPHSPASLCWNLRHIYSYFRRKKAQTTREEGAERRKQEKERKKGQRRKRNQRSEKKQTEGKRNARTEAEKSNKTKEKKTKKSKREQNKDRQGHKQQNEGKRNKKRQKTRKKRANLARISCSQIYRCTGCVSRSQLTRRVFSKSRTHHNWSVISFAGAVLFFYDLYKSTIMRCNRRTL